MIYGVAGYSIVRNTEAEAKAELARITDVKQSAAGYNNYQQWLAGTQLEQRVSLEDYSVSNRGLRSGLIGTPQQVLDRVEGVRSGRRGPAAAAVQPAAGGDGALRGAGHSTKPVSGVRTMTEEEWLVSADVERMVECLMVTCS